MKFSIIRSTEEMKSMADEWNALLIDCAIHVPFLRNEYLVAWWDTLGGGEWKQGELCVIIARHPDGKLAGIAPLFFTKNLAQTPALMLLGSIEISDYLDIIVKPADMSDFVSGLFEYLQQMSTPEWQVLDFYNIIENSPILPALKLACARTGWKLNVERLQPAPYIPLPGDWETYLGSIDKKQRHEIRRKMRRAETNEPPARWYILTDPSGLEQEMETFMQMMAQDAGKATFLTEAMRLQMHTLAQTAFKHGWLHLSFLEVGGEKAAGYLSFDDGGHLWVYNSGIQPDFAALSPGWVLLGYLIEWAIQNGRHSFDFMRGDELYKYRFGAVDRFVVRAVVQR